MQRRGDNRGDRVDRGGRGVLRDYREGRGQHLDYYKDLGIATTKEGYQRVQDDEARFQGVLKDNRATITKEQGQLRSQQKRLDDAYAKALGSLVTPEKAAEQSWNQAKKGFKTLNIFHQDGRIEKSYRLPAQTLDQIAAGYRTNTKGQYFGRWTDPKGKLIANPDYSTASIDSYLESMMGKPGQPKKISPQEKHTLWIGSQPSGMKHSDAAPLFEQFDPLEKTIYNEYTAAAINQATQARNTARAGIDQQYSGLRSQMAEGQGRIDAARQELDFASEERVGQYQQLRDDYQTKLANMRDIFKNFKVS